MAKARSEPKAAVAALESSVSHLLHRAVQLADDLHAETFGADGLTQRQFALLAAVEAKEGAAQAELVQLTGVDRSTLAELTSRMIARGLLIRERSETDGRANAVHLSEAGREALAEARARMSAADDRLLRRVGGRGRREAFVEMLSEMLSGERPAKADKAEKKRDKAAKKKTKKAA